MKYIKVTNKKDGIETWLNPTEIVGMTRKDDEMFIGLRDGRAFPVDQTIEELLTQLEG